MSHLNIRSRLVWVLHTVANLGCSFVALVPLKYVTNWDSLRVPMFDMLICFNLNIIVHFDDCKPVLFKYDCSIASRKTLRSDSESMGCS